MGVEQSWRMKLFYANCCFSVLQVLADSVKFISVAQLCPTLWTHGQQHFRPPCPLPTPGVHPNSCPLSRWCHPTISSSVISFSSCPQSFPASGSFQMSQLFTSGGPSTWVSASAWALPMNTQGWSPLEWTELLIWYDLKQLYRLHGLFFL